MITAKKQNYENQLINEIENYELLSSLKGFEVAIENKGLDVKVLDLSESSDICDFVLIASGTSERHVKTLADKIINSLHNELGEEVIHIDGYESASWIILDYGDLIVHIFHEPTRELFEFDKFLSDSKRIILPERLYELQMRSRTGLFR